MIAVAAIYLVQPVEDRLVGLLELCGKIGHCNRCDGGILVANAIAPDIAEALLATEEERLVVLAAQEHFGNVLEADEQVIDDADAVVFADAIDERRGDDRARDDALAGRGEPSSLLQL